ncbi:MAG: hypothetical protein FIB06_03585 [Betaproteobacteria bacterium]|nr:hypothetical protein [Betaproteobacteria bacterium]
MLARASRMLAYLAALAAGFFGGRLLAAGLGALLPAGSGIFFAATGLLALAVLAAGFGLENRWLWGRRFEPDDFDRRRIGTRSTLLGGSLPPLSLGLALGLLSALAA